MLQASDEFKSMLHSSHVIWVKASLVDAATDSVIETFDVVDGAIQIDGRSNAWRTLDVTVASPFTEALDKIDVTGAIRIDRGVSHGSQPPTEWITLGTFYVQETRREYESGTVAIAAADIGQTIEDYSLITPYAPQYGDQQMTFVQAITELIRAVHPSAVVEVGDGVDTAMTTAAGTVFTGSRWDAINQLGNGLGAVVHTTTRNSFRIDKIIEGGEPVWFFHSNEAGTLVSVTSVRSRREQYNAVQVRWETPNGTGMAFVVDSDPDSPTYWDGPFGRKPAAEESLPEVDSHEAGLAAARAMLTQHKGFARSVNFKSVANPLIEPYDVVRVSTPDGHGEDHIIDSISLDLTAASMSAETRMVRTVVPTRSRT